MELTIYQAVLSAALNAHLAPGSEKVSNSGFRPSTRAHGKVVDDNPRSARWSKWGVIFRRPAQIPTHFFCLWSVACILTGNNALGWVFGGALLMLAVSLVSSVRMPRIWETPYQKNRDGNLAKEYPALSLPVLDTVYTKLGSMNNLRDIFFATQDVDMIEYSDLLDFYGLNGAVLIDFTTSCDDKRREEAGASGQGILWQYSDGRVVIISSINIAKTTDLIHAVGRYCVDKGEVDLMAGRWVSCELASPEIVVGKEWYNSEYYSRADFLRDINDFFHKDNDSDLYNCQTEASPSQRNGSSQLSIAQSRFLLNALQHH